ncbi:hypothetical protein AU187_04370 [Mycobacterium sp. IS-1556]|nr:hypothetical protein AU185_11575 [Mycobacterium sp. GA-0227b]KUH87770.1 hypothetical protein AU187_04370 [Mycobacterium sp. IS-1556]
MMGMSILAGSIAVAPSAIADSADALRSAVNSMRSGTCGPLRPDPALEEAAADINRSADAWIDHTARAAPFELRSPVDEPADPLPLLKDLGYGGTRARMLQGAHLTEFQSIKALLLQGYDAIPDCSYTDYGANVLQNQNTGSILTTVVLAGA